MDQSVTKFMKPAVGLNPEVYEVAAQIVLKGHCKHDLALNAKGRYVEPDDPTAVKFCSLAAIMKGITQVLEKQDFNLYLAPAYQYTSDFEKFLGGVGICHWNNDPLRTPEEIAAKFREFAKTL